MGWPHDKSSDDDVQPDIDEMGQLHDIESCRSVLVGTITEHV